MAPGLCTRPGLTHKFFAGDVPKLIISMEGKLNMHSGPENTLEDMLFQGSVCAMVILVGL